VYIDEAGGQREAAEIDDLSRFRRAESGADFCDASALHEDVRTLDAALRQEHAGTSQQH
jgi:hypothetical protein